MKDIRIDSVARIVAIAAALVVVAISAATTVAQTPAVNDQAIKTEVNAFMDRYWQLFSAGKSQDGAPVEDLSEKVLRVVTEQLALDRTPLTREERRQITPVVPDQLVDLGPLVAVQRRAHVAEHVLQHVGVPPRGREGGEPGHELLLVLRAQLVARAALRRRDDPAQPRVGGG